MRRLLFVILIVFALACITADAPAFQIIQIDSGTDFSVVQTAVDSIGAGGGKIVIGNLVLTSQGAPVFIVNRNDITIEGNGDSTVFDNSNQNTRIFSITGSSNITFRKMRFKGDFVTNTNDYPAGGGFTIYNIPSSPQLFNDNIRIEDITFEHLLGPGIFVGTAATNLSVIKSRFIGGLSGMMAVGANDGRPIKGLSFKDNYAISDPVAARTTQTGITGSDNLLEIYGDVDGVQITGNDSDGNATSSTSTICNCFLMTGGMEGGVTRSVIVSNNTIRNHRSNRSYTFEHGGIMVWAMDGYNNNAIDIKIDNNSFYNVTTAVDVTGVASPVSMTNNTIRNAYVGIYLSPYGETGASQHVVDHNKLYEFEKWGIFVYGSKAKITGNRIDADGLLDEFLTSGIYKVYGTDVMIDNNMITGGQASQNNGRHSIVNIVDNPLIVNNKISNNLSSAAVYVYGGSPVFNDNYFSGNIVDILQ